MNMNLPNDNEVKEAVKVLEDLVKCDATDRQGAPCYDDEEKQAFTSAINLLQAYLKASAEMPEKKEEIKLAGKKGNSRFNHYVRGFNDCREQAILAFMKSFEGFERTIAELRVQIAKGGKCQECQHEWFIDPTPIVSSSGQATMWRCRKCLAVHITYD